MKLDIQNLRSKVQVALDELLSEHVIPFKLTAHAVTGDGRGQYVVPFYDSRIPSFRFSWPDENSSFNDVIRTAVLDRVKEMDGPSGD